MMNHHTNSDSPNRPLSKTNLLVVCFLATAISILTLALYDHFRYQPIMTVDVELIMQNKLNQLHDRFTNNPSGSLDKEAMLKLSQQWAAQLADEVSRLSREYHAIVLTRPAVIEGSIDMTQQIMNRIKN